jgi:hypothetical protein
LVPLPRLRQDAQSYMAQIGFLPGTEDAAQRAGVNKAKYELLGLPSAYPKNQDARSSPPKPLKQLVSPSGFEPETY